MSTGKAVIFTDKENLKIRKFSSSETIRTSIFLIAILFVIDMNVSLFYGSSAWFSVLTILIMLMILYRISRELHCYHKIQIIILHGVTDAELIEWRQLMTATDPVSDLPMIGRLNALAGNIGQTGKAALPFRMRLLNLVDALAVAPAGSHGVVEAIRSGYRPTTAFQVPLTRTMNETLVNGLLFTGIIGTFFGLMTFLGNPDFRSLLTSLGRGEGFDPQRIPAILDGFRIAFGSSLVAYISFVAGRFLLDVAAERFEQTQDVLANHLERRLEVAFAVPGAIAQVDLTTELRDFLQKQADGVQASVKATDSIIGRTKAITDTLLQATADLSLAIKGSQEMIQSTQATLSALKVDWRATTDIWRGATDKMAVATGSTAQSLESGAKQMLRIQEALAKAASAILGDLQALSTQTTSTLKMQEESLRTAFTGAAQVFADKLSVLTTDMQQSVDSYRAVAGILDQRLADTAVAQAQLGKSITVFAEVVDHHAVGRDDSYRQLVAVLGHRGDDLTALANRINHTLEALSQSLRTLDRAIYGNEGPDCLASSIQELTQVVSSLAAPMPMGSPVQ